MRSSIYYILVLLTTIQSYAMEQPENFAITSILNTIKYIQKNDEIIINNLKTITAIKVELGILKSSEPSVQQQNQAFLAFRSTYALIMGNTQMALTSNFLEVSTLLLQLCQLTKYPLSDLFCCQFLPLDEGLKAISVGDSYLRFTSALNDMETMVFHFTQSNQIDPSLITQTQQYASEIYSLITHILQKYNTEYAHEAFKIVKNINQ